VWKYIKSNPIKKIDR